MGEHDDFPALLAGLRAGDPAAADELCRRFGPFVRAAVRRRLHESLRTGFDSLDFVQDVWASVLTAPCDRLAFDTPDDLLRYLARVAHNKVIDVSRRLSIRPWDVAARQDPANGASVVHEASAVTATPSQWAIAGERWERLLSRFPAGQRVVLERLREGHTNRDIARMAGVSEAQVGRIVRRLKDLAGL